MIFRIIRALFGEMSKNEMKKFGICSLVFTLLIGGYWMLRVLKDALFDDLVGIVHQPKVKIASMFVIIPLVLIYTKLVDTVERHKLFYFICSTYALLFTLIAYFCIYPAGIFTDSYFSFIPGNLLGWVTYISVESFGSLAIGLFWAFMASTTTSASAKRGYPMMYAVGQFGTIGATTMVANAPFFGVSHLWMFATAGIFIVPFLIALLINSVPQEELQSEVPNAPIKKESTGLFEGLRLLSTTPYLMGVLVISTFYEVVATIMEFQMKMLGRQIYTTKETFASFLGIYGQATNILAFSFAIVGTGFLVRNFGVRFCLIMFPLISGSIVSVTLFHSSVWVFFLAAVITKGLSYTLNNPVKEMMYIPTSKDVKFKAKSWIEAFGSRGSKGTGAAINNFFARDLGSLLTFGTITSLSLISIWAVVAFIVGTKYNGLIRDQKTIE
jgi:AAA family ATP:ADP antiporter